MRSFVPREYHPFRSAASRDRYLARYDEEAESWPVASEIRMVDTDQGRTFVRISGPADGRPLVLLPGTWSPSRQWATLIGALSERYRTYAVDSLYDLGRSVSARPARGTADYMAWLDGLFDGLELPEGIELMGVTRGAWLAAEYALHAPCRLAKVVWLTPVGIARMLDVGGAAGAMLGLSASLAPSHITVGALYRWLMPDLALADRPQLDRFVDETVFGLRCFDTSQVGSSLGPRAFSDDELRSIRIPALYAAGELERMSSVPAAAARLNRVAPQIKTVVLPGAGHAVLSLQPDVVSRTVLEFLDA
jgi:pimeloyl-ACP methyl ester carboxylesterase